MIHQVNRDKFSLNVLFILYLFAFKKIINELVFQLLVDYRGINFRNIETTRYYGLQITLKNPLTDNK